MQLRAVEPVGERPDTELRATLLDDQTLVLLEIAYLSWCAVPGKILRRGAQHPSIEREPAGNVEIFNIVADVDLEIHALFDKVNHLVGQGELNV